MTPAYRVRLAGTDVTFDVPAGERILSGARRAGVWLPYECGWGGCGTCKVTVLEGTTELLLDPVPCADPRDARRRRVPACQSTPTSDLVLRTSGRTTAEPHRSTADHTARLASREPVGPGTLRLGFTLDRPAAYRPGQHAVLEPAPGLRRCYSMAGLPGTAEVEFVVRCSPGRPGSEALQALREGAAIHAELPYGDMWLRDDPGPVVLVAGGTGVSAILALARQLAAERTPRRVVVGHGARSRAELVCWDELRAAVDALPHATLRGSLVAPEPGWTGTTGLVTTALAAELEALPDLAAARFHVAGPPAMTVAVRILLRDRGVQLDRVHHDSFG